MRHFFSLVERERERERKVSANNEQRTGRGKINNEPCDRVKCKSKNGKKLQERVTLQWRKVRRMR